jgi:hypothetical protein
LGYIKDKLNEITSVHGPDTQTGVRWKVLGVDCKVREANFRCGVEAGDEETVLGGDGGTRFQYNQANKTKKNNTLIIPLSDWTNSPFLLLCKHMLSMLINGWKSNLKR